jgi:hypothetical protein
MAAGDIEVYGAIRAQTVEGKAAYASQIYDEALGKYQSEINQEVGSSSKDFYFSDINTSDINEGTLTGTVKTKLIALRSEASTNDAKLVMLQGGDTDVVATIESFGSTFQMWFIVKGRRCEVSADPSDTTWTAHWTETLESITQQEFNAIFS